MANHLLEKQKVGSAIRVSRLAGETFYHIMNSLARPAGSTLSRRDNRSMRELFFLILKLIVDKYNTTLLARAKGSRFFSCSGLLKVTRLGG